MRTPVTHIELAFDSGDESLSVRTFLVEEGLNALFTIAVSARSGDPDLDLASFVGQEAVFYLVGGMGRERSWTGICTRMEQVRVEPAGLSTYELTIMPYLWLLTQRRNHRIFQHQSIPDILAKLLAEWGISPIWQIDHALYPSLELRIQYGESDYDFLSRLVEEAGITFFFMEDLEQSSRVIFNDRPQGAEPRLERPPFVDAPEASQAGRLEYMTAVRVSDRVRPGKHVVRDFDFRRPAHRLVGDASAGAGGLDAMLEQYHYLPGVALAETGQARDTPIGDDRGVGRHADATGQGLAQRSLHSHQALKRAVHFQTNAFDLAPGVVFSIDKHPRSDLAADKALLIVHARIEGTVGEEWTQQGKALFADQPYYPAQVTRKPCIDGVQSAMVVGPDGQEIHTDEHGRVRVQFHWDREGEFNEESFVWIRVSQGWAGGGYGMLSLPRVGHEVLVQFMDGDPDSPLVVGRAFNAAMTVPYALPEHKTVSTWRSASSPGADGFNELKMEDKKGQELLYLQAEKDHAKLVKNDEVSLIGNDRTKLVEHDEMSSIKNDRVKVVQHDERASVQNDRTGLVGNDEHLAVSRDRVAQIKKNETLAVGHNHATQVGKSASLAVGESRAAHVGKSDQVSVGASQSVTVGQSRSTTVGVNYSTLVGSRYSVMIGNGLGGQLARLLGGAIDGNLLGSLGSIASPLLAGPMQRVMGALKKGPFGDTPLTTFIQGPMATLESVLPGKLNQVMSMIPGARSLLFGAGDAPTGLTMVDKKITLTTGDSTIELEGGKITITTKESISLAAGQAIDLTSGMMLQAQANTLVKIQAGPTPPLKADGRPVKTMSPPVGDLVLVGMNQVEVGAKELLVLGSKNEAVLVAETKMTFSGEKGITVSSASEVVVKGVAIQLNPPEPKKAKPSEPPPAEPPPETTRDERARQLGIATDSDPSSAVTIVASKDGAGSAQRYPVDKVRAGAYTIERYRTANGDAYAIRENKNPSSYVLLDGTTRTIDRTTPPNRLGGMTAFRVYAGPAMDGTAIPLSGFNGRADALVNLTDDSSLYIPTGKTISNADRVTVINPAKGDEHGYQQPNALRVRRDLVKVTANDGSSRLNLSTVSVNGTSLAFRDVGVEGKTQVIGVRTRAWTHGDGKGIAVYTPGNDQVVVYQDNGSGVGRWDVVAKSELVQEGSGQPHAQMRITQVASNGGASVPTMGRSIPLSVGDVFYGGNYFGYPVTIVRRTPDLYQQVYDSNGTEISNTSTGNSQFNRGVFAGAKNAPTFLPVPPHSGANGDFTAGANFGKGAVRTFPALAVGPVGGAIILGAEEGLGTIGSAVADHGDLNRSDVVAAGANAAVTTVLTFGTGLVFHRIGVGLLELGEGAATTAVETAAGGTAATTAVSRASTVESTAGKVAAEARIASLTAPFGSENFPTPAIAMTPANEIKWAKIQNFGTLMGEQANVAEASLPANLSRLPTAERDQVLERLYQEQQQWRYDLEKGENPKILAKIEPGDPNMDPFGRIETLRGSPAFEQRAAIGEIIDQRLGSGGAEVVQNRITLPDGRVIDGNIIYRGRAAEEVIRLRNEEWAAKYPEKYEEAAEARPGQTDLKYGFENGAPRYITQTAEPANQQTLHNAGVQAISDLVGQSAVIQAYPALLAQKQTEFANALYYLFNGPIYNRGSDSVIRLFGSTTYQRIFGRPLTLPQDVDIRAYGYTQEQFSNWLRGTMPR